MTEENKGIGGYFSLELPKHEEYHKDAIRLNTGRNCLEYILRSRKYNKVYIPYYTCEVILEPFQKTKTEYAFYHINQDLELAETITLKQGDALLYTNYFGLKQRYVELLVKRFGAQLIVDNTQAFYARPLPGIDTFYTCRKFFGVPDGAYLYSTKKIDIEIEQDYSYDRVVHLVKRIDISAEEGFKDFRRVDDGFDNQPIRKMSKLTQRMMQSIDYEAVSQQRIDNYLMLQKVLGSSNRIDLPLEGDAVPLVYPYLGDVRDLREKLIANKIFVARYWPNVLNWTTKDDIEYTLAFQIQPLPIDQRYNNENMERIIDIIRNL